MNAPRLLALAFLAVSVAPPPGLAQVPETPLQFPVGCEIGTDCFVQQLPDMAGGPGATDPFCGRATYDDHDGIDVRLRALNEIARGVPVRAAAAGTVRGARDGMPDAMIDTDEKRDALRGVECGNGVVIDHGDGLETQYCHMRLGSLRVRPGQTVEAGQTLGEIGYSGLAQFAHLHLSVRRNGEKLDPISGKVLGSGCTEEAGARRSLFAEDVLAQLSGEATAILDLGLSGAPVDYNRLVAQGAPDTPSAQADASIVWGWFINLRKGDRVAFRMRAPSGEIFFQGESEPLETDKASYSAFAGRSRPPLAGEWLVRIAVLRGGVEITSAERAVEVASNTE